MVIWPVSGYGGLLNSSLYRAITDRLIVLKILRWKTRFYLVFHIFYTQSCHIKSWCLQINHVILKIKFWNKCRIMPFKAGTGKQRCLLRLRQKWVIFQHLKIILLWNLLKDHSNEKFSSSFAGIWNVGLKWFQ